LGPFFETELAAGRIDWLPSDGELRALLPVVQERLPTLSAAGDVIDFLFVNEIRPDPALIVPKRWDAATTAAALDAARRTIAEVGEVSWEADEIEPPLRRLIEDRGWKAGDLFMSVRVAITGRTATPPLFDTMVALGYERTLARLDWAIELLGARAAEA
jgi:glutamyl-tRNA synthetase